MLCRTVATLKIDDERRPHLAIAGKAERRRHHPHDRGGYAVDTEELANDVWRSAEALLPDAFTDDRHRLGTGPALLVAEVAAEQGGDLQ